MSGILIELKTQTNESIGAIEFYNYDDENNINLNSIFIKKEYTGKSYAILLIFLMFIYIYYFNINIKTISLDDDSDLSLTTDSIYYKLGFRLFDKNDMPNMKLFFTKNTTNKNNLIKTYNDTRFKYKEGSPNTNILNVYNDIGHYLNTNSYIKTKINQLSNINNLIISIKNIGDDNNLIDIDTKDKKNIKLLFKTFIKSYKTSNTLSVQKSKKTIKKPTKKPTVLNAPLNISPTFEGGYKKIKDMSLKELQNYAKIHNISYTKKVNGKKCNIKKDSLIKKLSK